MNNKLKKFIVESNAIEGITKFDGPEQLEAYIQFLDQKELTVPIIEDFALGLYETTVAQPGHYEEPELRRRKGQDVRVGSFIPQKGGPRLVTELKGLLKLINIQEDSFSAYTLHRNYETLHPLTDYNGRTGRAIWAWLMIKDGYTFELGFLHKWYYQSLDHDRD